MPENEAGRLGEYVRKARTAKGLSVRGLASTAKVDATWLSRVEHGTYESPDPRSLYRLARALDVEVHDLYLVAGYEDGHSLPGLVPYLRAKYDLPDDAVAQLQAHFELINEKYQAEKGDHLYDKHHHDPA